MLNYINYKDLAVILLSLLTSHC